jgi:TetR/AcrR family transcriptional repressor of nem operon
MVEACAGAFESKDRIRETGAASGQDNIADLFNRYLSPGHRDSAATGCPIPPLLSTISHRSPELRRIFTEGVLRQLEQIALRAPGGGAEAHVAAAASMFGALALSRAVDDEALSDLILRHTREYWIDALEAEPAAVAAGGHEAS